MKAHSKINSRSKLGFLAAAFSIAMATGTACAAPATTRVLETYRPLEPFMHVLGDKAYLGYFRPKGSACSLWVLAEPADDISTKKIAQQETAFDLPANQAAVFTVDKDWRLTLECGADARSLTVTERWPPSDGGQITIGQNR